MATHVVRVVAPDHRVEEAISLGLQAVTVAGAAFLVLLTAAMSF